MLTLRAMRALEVRFHPLERNGPTFVVVGHVVWDDEDTKQGPRIEPTPALAKQTAPATMLATVRHLVLMTSPHSFERLQRLQNRFWSFVEVDTLPTDVAST